MVMAVKVLSCPTTNNTLVLSGYEGGLTAVHRLPPRNSSSVVLAELVYLSQPHTQPILSLDISPDGRTYYTSSADAIIAAHRIPEVHSGNHAQEELPTIVQKRVPSVSRVALEEEGTTQDVVASSTGSYEDPEERGEIITDTVKPSSSPQGSSLSFSKQRISPTQPSAPKAAGLSSLLSAASSQTKFKPAPPAPPPTTVQPPHKTADTKHSGQQSLRVRSDGRILATGGWDMRIRIYSTKTLQEVAVLKWHKEGVYAVDFAQVLEAKDLTKDKENGDGEIVKKETGLGKLQRQREQHMQLRHWIVAGAKDGKVSLWEIF
jgi:WD40 repeat protein